MMQILTVFPGFVLQQHLNSIAIRQLLPRGVDPGLFNALYMRRSEVSASGPPMAMR
jgi:hypothetical protein